MSRTDSLASLHEATANLTVNSSQDIGVCAVMLDHICGTVGRHGDFDQDFRPLKQHMRPRWMRVAHAFDTDVPLDAVELIQFGDRYFVEDGHHRVSVARCRGQVDIDARVRVWKGSIKPSAVNTGIHDANKYQFPVRVSRTRNRMSHVLFAINTWLQSSWHFSVQP